MYHQNKLSLDLAQTTSNTYALNNDRVEFDFFLRENMYNQEEPGFLDDWEMKQDQPMSFGLELFPTISNLIEKKMTSLSLESNTEIATTQQSADFNYSGVIDVPDQLQNVQASTPTFENIQHYDTDESEDSFSSNEESKTSRRTKDARLKAGQQRQMR